MSKSSNRTQQGLRRMIEASARLGLYEDEDFDAEERLTLLRRKRERHHAAAEYADAELVSARSKHVKR